MLIYGEEAEDKAKFIDLLTVSKDIHLIVQFALIIVGVGVVGALISYCSNLSIFMKKATALPEVTISISGCNLSCY